MGESITYTRANDFRRRGQQSNKFELRLRTIHPEGLIAWIGRGKLEHLVLSLRGGYVVLSYKSKTEQISVKSRVSGKFNISYLYRLVRIVYVSFFLTDPH